MNQMCCYSYPFPHYNPCPRQTFNTCSLAPNDGKEHFGQVFVKTITGKTITIDFDLNPTILDIKEKLREKEGVPVDQMMLLKKLSSGASIPLFDDKTLQQYCITDGETLRVILCLDPKKCRIDPRFRNYVC